jgi:hypothetical protein
MPLRDYKRKAPDAARIAVYVPREIAEWKRDTMITWGEIMRAGVASLSAGSKVVLKKNSPEELKRRLDFFAKKVLDMQKELAENKERGVLNETEGA